MQDIIDTLSPMGYTKGAIYHHFQNKEAILRALLESMSQEGEEIEEVIGSKLNGRDKIKALILGHLRHFAQHREEMAEMSALFASPKLKEMRLNLAQSSFAPLFEGCIEQGNSDGSLSVAYPKAASEMLSWGVYVWLDVLMYPLEGGGFIDKVRHFRLMCEGVGLSVIDEEISAEFRSLCGQ